MYYVGLISRTEGGAGVKRLLSLLLVLLLCTGCAGPAMYSEDRSEDHFHGVCEAYTGQHSCTLILSENACLNLRCTVERKSGSLDLKIAGGEEYAFNDLRDPMTQVLQLTEPGEYILSVNAESFTGSFRFEWEIAGAVP